MTTEIESSPQQRVGRIVVGVDGSPQSEQALRWAAEQARLTGQEVDAVIVSEFPKPGDVPSGGDLEWLNDAAGVLSKSVENVLGDVNTPRVTRDVLHGHPAKMLLEYARSAELLVVGSRGHGGFTGLLLGSVSDHVVVHATCPVVVVHGDRPVTDAGRIIVGVDGSPESERALGWAVRQARLTGGEVHAVLSWFIPATFRDDVLAEPDWAGDSRRTLSAAVTRVLDVTGAAGVEQDIVGDQPAAALLRASEGAALLVVGSGGLGGFAGLLLGSVSRQVAAHASCPVLIHHGGVTPDG